MYSEFVQNSTKTIELSSKYPNAEVSPTTISIPKNVKWFDKTVEIRGLSAGYTSIIAQILESNGKRYVSNFGNFTVRF